MRGGRLGSCENSTGSSGKAGGDMHLVPKRRDILDIGLTECFCAGHASEGLRFDRQRVNFVHAVDGADLDCDEFFHDLLLKCGLHYIAPGDRGYMVGSGRNCVCADCLGKAADKLAVKAINVCALTELIAKTDFSQQCVNTIIPIYVARVAGAIHRCMHLACD